MHVSTFVLSACLVYAASATSLHNANQVAAPAPNSTLDYLVRTLDGLDRGLDFFQKVYRDVNLDAVIGTRIVEATFKVILQHLDESDLISKVPSQVVSHIRRLHDVARDVSEKATPHIMANEPEYFADLGPLLAQNIFALDYATRDMSQSALVWPVSGQESMTESESDACITELAGTKTGRFCDITEECWKKMTHFGYSRYSLSHQIFYLELAEGFGCLREVDWLVKTHRQGSVEKLHDTYCGNMYVEASTIAEDGFSPDMRDLFMEQAALCGLLGYRDFFSSGWVDHILSWQDKENGCYKWEGWRPHKMSEPSSDPAFHRKRSKREEKRVTHGCLCHRTTVAISALAQYVRYILEVWFQEQL